VQNGNVDRIWQKINYLKVDRNVTRNLVMTAHKCNATFYHLNLEHNEVFMLLTINLNKDRCQFSSTSL